jgi:hypothetical protein
MGTQVVVQGTPAQGWVVDENDVSELPSGDYYIDGVNGNDANAGTNKSIPLRTLAGFFTKYGKGLSDGSTVRVWLAGTGSSDPWATPTAEQVHSVDNLYLGGNAALYQAIVFRGAKMIRATLATGAAFGVALDAVTPARLIDELGAPAAGGHRIEYLFTVAAPGWTVNDMGPRLQGLFLRITRGGVKRWPLIPIADNTAASIILDVENVQAAAMLADLLATDTIEIVRPSAVLQGATVVAATRFVNVTGSGASFAPNVPATPLVTGDQGHALEQLELRNLIASVDGLSLDRCRMTGAQPAYFRGSAQFINCTGAGLIVDYQGTAQGGGGAPTSRPDSATDPTPANAGCAVELMARRLTIGEAGRAGSYLQRAPLSCYGSASTGIEVNERGSTFRQQIDTYLGGDANTTAGILASAGAFVRLPAGSGAGTHRVIVGGAGLGPQIAGHAGLAWGAAGGAFEDAMTWNGNYNVSLYTAATPVATGDDSRIYAA